MEGLWLRSNNHIFSLKIDFSIYYETIVYIKLKRKKSKSKA